MEASLWEYIRSFISVVVVPAFSVLFWSYKKGVNKIESLERQVIAMKIENATVKEQLKNITERLNELKMLMNVLIKQQGHK